MIWALLLLLSLLPCSAQQNSFADLAFMEPPSAVSGPVLCGTSTNNVQWTLTSVDAVWTNAAGSEVTSPDMASFQTNDPCNILSLQFNTFLTSLTNVSVLTNLRFFFYSVSDESTLDRGIFTNLYALTNIEFSAQTNAFRVDVTGCSNLMKFSFASDALLTNVYGVEDSTNYANENSFLDNCSLDRNVQSNLVLTWIIMASNANIQNWSVNMTAQKRSAYTNTQATAVSIQMATGTYMIVSGLQDPTLNEQGNVLTNAEWSFDSGTQILCEPSTSTYKSQWSDDGGSTWNDLSTGAFPGYDTPVNEGDLSGLGNPIILQVRVVDTQTGEVGNYVSTGDYTDPPP